MMPLTFVILIWRHHCSRNKSQVLFLITENSLIKTVQEYLTSNYSITIPVRVKVNPMRCKTPKIMFWIFNCDLSLNIILFLQRKLDTVFPMTLFLLVTVKMLQSGQ